jgi:hypothetical protein
VTHSNPTAQDLLNAATWRVSRHSGSDTSCVEVAALADNTVAVRNSNQPEAGVVIFDREEITAFFAGVRDGEFDDLTVRGSAS